MLEQNDIARHESGGGKSEHLPERKIPGHYGQDGTHGLIVDGTGSGFGGNGLVSQERFRVFGVIAATQGAFRGFIDGSLERLAHLQSHQAAELRFFPLENSGRSEEQARAFLKRSGAPGIVSRDRSRELLFDLRPGERLESAKGFAGGWINGCDADDGILLSIIQQAASG